jgi:hypothetical protein
MCGWEKLYIYQSGTVPDPDKPRRESEFEWVGGVKGVRPSQPRPPLSSHAHTDLTAHYIRIPCITLRRFHNIMNTLSYYPMVYLIS